LNPGPPQFVVPAVVVIGTVAMAGRPISGWQKSGGGGVGTGVAVGAGVGVGVGTGVGVGRQPVAVQASQQLEYCPTQAAPPDGALHWVAEFLTLQVVFPVRVVRQHDTAPGRPQVDLLTHFITLDWHCAGKVAFATRSATTPRAHFM
jgi:hypothetical protein